MGKRSDFKRRPQDAYDTPPEAVEPLVPHLPKRFMYWEPCAGNMSLCEAMWDNQGIPEPWCVLASDVEPRGRLVRKADALDLVAPDRADFIITNPPWTRSILHPMIDHFRRLRPTWLLFDADWMHNRQAAPYLPFCHKIVSVGRVKWIPGSPHTGKDNCAWYLFDREAAQTQFFGRQI